jgi:succinate dehydrogenase / fumarate reductase cytochrome b subunit
MQLAHSTTAPSVAQTSIGRKVLVALTGLGLMGFLIGHLSGNMLLLKGDGGAAFDAYAHFMKTTWFIWVAELAIFGLIVGHIVLALTTHFRNVAARGGVGYRRTAQNQTSFFSKYMIHTGTIFLIFLVIHLWSFFITHKVAEWLTGATWGHPESLYEAVKHKFSNPLFSIFYVVAMVALSFHLIHGFWSAFQTLGLLVNKRLEAALRTAAVVFSVVVSAGFSLVPLYFMFTA